MGPAATRPLIKDESLAAELKPLHLISPETNWTYSEKLVDKLAFVRKQSIGLAQ
jgi:hypothetical protein